MIFPLSLIPLLLAPVMDEYIISLCLSAGKRNTFPYCWMYGKRFPLDKTGSPLPMQGTLRKQGRIGRIGMPFHCDLQEANFVEKCCRMRNASSVDKLFFTCTANGDRDRLLTKYIVHRCIKRSSVEVRTAKFSYHCRATSSNSTA